MANSYRQREREGSRHTYDGVHCIGLFLGFFSVFWWIFFSIINLKMKRRFLSKYDEGGSVYLNKRVNFIESIACMLPFVQNWNTFANILSERLLSFGNGCFPRIVLQPDSFTPFSLFGYFLANCWWVGRQCSRHLNRLTLSSPVQAVYCSCLLLSLKW